jgi:hypothetical protein
MFTVKIYYLLFASELGTLNASNGFGSLLKIYTSSRKFMIPSWRG